MMERYLTCINNRDSGTWCDTHAENNSNYHLTL